MKAQQKSSIWKDLKGALRVTSLGKLQQKGKKNVRVIGMDQIVQLIDRAVDRVLEERMVELEDRERTRIVSEARQEFERLSTEVSQLETDRDAVLAEVQEAEGRVDSLRLEVQRSETLMEEIRRERRIAEFLPSDENNGRERWIRQVGAIVEETLTGFGPLPDHAAQRLVHRLTEVLPAGDPFAEEGPSSDFEYREQISVLERRMAKLRRRLQEAEKVLASAQGGEIDPGIASIYRDVQGLGDDARGYEKKKGLMSVIYEANVKLQDEPI